MSDDKYGPGRTFDAMSARGLAGKRDYVRSLEQRRDEEAMSLLVECLCDESWYLRELAETALLRLGDHAGETLLPLLEQGLWFSRVSLGACSDGWAIARPPQGCCGCAPTRTPWSRSRRVPR